MIIDKTFDLQQENIVAREVDELENENDAVEVIL